jgi:hypothetical protein
VARYIKRPSSSYKRLARDLSRYDPKIKTLSKKRTLSATDKRAISRIENKVHKLTAGTQRLVSLTPKQVKQLKDKSFLAPGLNAIVDRNISDKTRAVVKNGRVFLKENGRTLSLIKADASDPEKFAAQAEALYKGKRGRYNVWIRFKNGRSNSSFADKKALLNFIVYLYEKYEPDWAREGYDVDEMIQGFEVYEQPPGFKIGRKSKTKPRRKTSIRRKASKPKKKTATKPRRRKPLRPTPTRKKKTRTVVDLVRARFKKPQKAKRPLLKIPPKKTAARKATPPKKIAVRKRPVPPKKVASKRIIKRGKAKKNNRRRLRN